MTPSLHTITRAAVFMAVSVALVVPTPVAAAQHEHGTPATASRAALAKVAPLKGAVGPLPPLPRVPFAPARPMPVVQEVFEFAARHPEVLAYVPCYCGCEQLGHKGNHDCFVKGRSANGNVTEWEAHGIGCAICIDVGREAMLLFNSGSSVTAIRAAIEKRYGGNFPSSTPTPRPPQAPTAKPAAPAKKAPPSNQAGSSR
jgi:hypothetical protein